jgi:hypothetical protein
VIKEPAVTSGKGNSKKKMTDWNAKFAMRPQQVDVYLI